MVVSMRGEQLDLSRRGYHLVWPRGSILDHLAQGDAPAGARRRAPSAGTARQARSQTPYRGSRKPGTHRCG